MSRANRWHLIVLLLFVTLSLMLAQYVQPYRTLGTSLLSDAFFPSATFPTAAGARWEARGAQYLALQTGARDQSLSLSQWIPAPQDSHYLLLVAQVRSQMIVPAETEQHFARLAMFPYLSATGEPDYSGNHTIVKLRDTTPWTEYQQLFLVEPDIERWKLQLQLFNASGEIYARDVQLYRAEPSAYWKSAQYMVIGAGCIFLLGLYLRYPIQGLRSYGALALLSAVTITLLTLIPAALKIDIYRYLVAALQWAPAAHASAGAMQPAVSEGNAADSFFAAAHFLFFALTAWLIWRAQAPRSPAEKFADLFTLALVTECMQLFIADRNPALIDVVIDMAGASLGTAVYLAANRQTLSETRTPQ